MSMQDYLLKMVKVIGCEYIPSGGEDCPAYISFKIEFPEGFQLFTDNENILSATINVQ